jgi:mRNA interferase MazF
MENYKNFDEWNKIKKTISVFFKNKYFKERDLWWSKIGCNLGHEQDGKGVNFERPVLIIKKFNNRIFWAIPLSTKIKNNKYYFSFFAKDGIKRSAILSQIKLMDIVRLEEKISYIDIETFNKIKKLARCLLD